MNQSDSQSSSSQSDFNNLNKLNPDMAQDEEPKVKAEQQPKSTQKKITEIDIDKEPSFQPPQINIPKKLTIKRQNKPRLIIDHMILKNFKSYAGTLQIGPFHKNFTSIVGPNGSGKSNLIESMLFIFGFSASWMRLNKLQQLIHNSSKLNNISSCSVEVFFKKILDNNDGSISEVQNSAFSIRRSVNTSSVSKYFLNNVESTQSEVKTKLKSEGIDLTNNRFLILQGQVQQISQMKQKSGDKDKPGFLEYLQDIIGSNQFIDKIEESVKEYNTLQQQRHQKGERMKLVEGELKNMTQQKQQAIKFVKKQRKIFQIQSVLHQVLRSNADYELKKVKGKIEELEKKKEQVIKEQRQKMAKQSQKVAEIKRIRNDVEKLEKEKIHTKSKMEEMTLEDNNLKQQIAYHSEDQVKYQKKVEELNKQYSKILDQANQIQKNLPKKQQKLKLDKKQLEQITKKLSKYDRPQLQQKIKHLQNQIKKLNLTQNSLVSKRDVITGEIDKLTSNKEDHVAKLAEYQKLLKGHMEFLAKIEVALENAAVNYKTQKQKHIRQVGQRNKLRNEYDQMDILMKEQRSDRQQQGQFNNMFSQIMKANIPGVIGRLGDLGTIPKQYDEVITTACGRLDNIVVRNVQAAEQVLKLLKENHLGRVTCIILDKLGSSYDFMNMEFRCPDKAVRLFDIIQPESEEVKVAFYFALQNTLYCQSSDFAMRLSMGDENNRRRVIARKQRGAGFLIYELNGLMKSQPIRRNGFQRRAEKTKRTGKQKEQQDKQNERRMNQITKQLEALNSQITQKQKNLKSFQDNFQIMKTQKLVTEGKIRDVQEQIKDTDRIIQKSKGNKNSLQSFKKEVQALSSQLNKRQNQTQKFSQQLQTIQNQQKKYQTSEISSLRQKYKTLRAQYLKSQKQVQKQQTLIFTVQNRIKQVNTKRQGQQKSIQKVKQLIAKNHQDAKKLQDMGMMIYRRNQEAQKQINELRTRQEQVKGGLDDCQQQVNESRRRIEESKQAVETARRDIRKFEEDYKFACHQLERIRKLYTEMTSTYDFLEELDDIQKMSLEASMHEGNSILDMSLLNMSSDMTNLSGKKNMGFGRDNKYLDVKLLEKVNPHQDLTEEELDTFLLFEQKLRASLNSENTEIKKMEGKNLQIISEYRTKYIDFKQKLKLFQQVKQKQQMLKRVIDQMKQKRFNMFRQGFAIINSKLKQVYQLLTNGGDAEMELIDSLDPFSDGVNFSVRPPKKAWKEINKLSGGEKTLSSLSLIFALHYYKPTPLYFMDQIDAALDFKNVSIVGDYIKKRTKNAQFIIISLRNNMFDLADKLIGVYKTFDQTKVINLAAAKLLGLMKQKQKIEQEKKQKQNKNVNLIA